MTRDVKKLTSKARKPVRKSTGIAKESTGIAKKSTGIAKKSTGIAKKSTRKFTSKAAFRISTSIRLPERCSVKVVRRTSRA
jgi:hypothetical protein